MYDSSLPPALPPLYVPFPPPVLPHFLLSFPLHDVDRLDIRMDVSVIAGIAHVGECLERRDTGEEEAKDVGAFVPVLAVARSRYVAQFYF